MKIGFDAKRFFNNFTGLGNYSRFVIKALSEYAPENEYLLYSPKVKSHPEYNSILDRPNVQVVTPPPVYNFFFAKSLWRTWGISRERTTKNLNVFHGLSQELPVSLPGTVRKIVTVHDLIFIRYPALYQSIDVSIYKTKVKAACNQADRIVAVSKQTRQDLIDFFKIDASKIDVVYQGCHPNFQKVFTGSDIQEIKKVYELPEHYILSVGTVEERKNVLLLVKAFSLLPSELKSHIVIVGRPTSYRNKIVEEAGRLGVLDRLIFLHDVSFTDLPVIYQGADVFVYPSVFEGFGIPIVEALESSVPVIAATGSCLEEAGGERSIYVNPSDHEELARQLIRVLQDNQLRSEMISGGKQHVSRFQPPQIAKQLLAIYNSNR